MTVNPNYPVLDYAISWPNGPQQSCQQAAWCSVTERTDATYGGSTSWQRGKQYWLDQVQPGMMNISLTNKDGALDPSNSASPFGPWVVPYRLFRMRAQWPPTDNLLTQNQATAGEAATSIGSLSLAGLDQVEKPWPAGTTPPAWCVLQNAVSPTTVATSASAWQGTQVFNHAVQSAAAYPFNAVGMQGWSVAGGKAHAFTLHARAAAGITASAAAAVQWLDASGALISTSTGGASALATGTSWTTLTLAATAPANAAAAVAYLAMETGPAATSWTLQSDGWDIRKGTLAPAYITPGTWFPVFTGYVSGFPQRWVASGLYGVTDLTIVDEFAVLSQRNLLGPFKADLMALGPNFLYALDESSGSSTFADTAGNRAPAVTQRGSAAGSLNAGSSLSSADNLPPGPDYGIALTGAFLGTAGPALETKYKPQSTVGLSGTVQLSPNPATGNVGVPTTGPFSRVIAARITQLSQYTAVVWNCNDPSFSYGVTLDINAQISGTLATYFWQATVAGPAAASGVITPPLPAIGTDNTSTGSDVYTLTDSDWHLFGISMSSDGKTVQLWYDGATTPVTVTTAASMRPPAGPPTSGYSDTIGGIFTSGTVSSTPDAQIALACELPLFMDATTWANLSQSWRNAWSTTATTAEATSARYRRILGWLGQTGPSRISSGVCKSVGPATDIAVDPTNPTAGLQALQNVADTENGQHFIAADGAVVFQSRADRYNKTALITFGEKAALGEVPYLDVQTEHDTSRVANDVQVTAQYGSSLYRRQDAASQSKYGAIQLQRTVNSVDPNELTAAAQALLIWNKDPQQRIKTLTVDPSSNPAIWPVVLAAELGLPCQVNRRPQGATQISLPGFIEQISGTLDGKTNQMLLTFQITPNTNRSFAQFDVGRFAPDPGSMTLQSGITAAATSLTIATAVGSPTASNKTGSYPFEIVIGSEQITLTAAPGGTVSPQTFTVVRGANGTTAAAHSAGAVISLAVPAVYAY